MLSIQLSILKSREAAGELQRFENSLSKSLVDGEAGIGGPDGTSLDDDYRGLKKVK